MNQWMPIAPYLKAHNLFNILAVTSVVSLGTLVLSDGAFAQNIIVPDSTFGSESSQVNRLDATTDHIEGGAIRGPNLFHSFLEFNVAEGHQAYFTPLPSIENILSRVTGSNPSAILGTLGVEGVANLFLLNPQGIAFGPNASLDIEGSFFASTADALTFADGSTFRAVAPETASVLTVSVPLGLQYGPNGPNLTANFTPGSTIENVGTLSVGEDLTLAADQLDLQGQVVAGRDLTLQATDTLHIRDTPQRPFVAAAGGQLTVQGDVGVDIVALAHVDSGLFSGGDIVLRSANPVGGDAHYWSGGNFRVERLDGSVGDLVSPYDPIIRTLGDVEIDDYQGASLHILAGGSVELGSAEITAQEQGRSGLDFLREAIALSDGTLVEIDGGAQPTLDIRAGVAADAIATPLSERFLGDALGQSVPSGADITVGGVRISVPHGLVLLTNNYMPNPELEAGSIVVNGDIAIGVTGDRVSTDGREGGIYLEARDDILVMNSTLDTSGGGDVGDIVINAGDTVRFDEPPRGNDSGASTQVPSQDEGQGGNIHITAPIVQVLNGARLEATTAGIGNAGNVMIIASRRVTFEGDESGAFTEVTFQSDGQGGDIDITAPIVQVLNGARLDASTDGSGDAGDVMITASETVTFSGNLSIASTRSGSEGRGGTIDVTAPIVEVLNGASLEATTTRSGAAGHVMIDASETVIFRGNDSGAFTKVALGGDGRGGDIVVNVPILELLNGASLEATTNGSADAGDVRITASENITLRNNGDIETSVENGDGNGGNIILTAGAIFAFDDSDILAFSPQGRGGNITLNTPVFLGENYQPSPEGIDLSTLDGNNRVDIDATGTIAGVVTLPNISFIQNSLNNLPDTVINTEQLIAGSCIARTEQKGSFIISGSGGLPARPGDGFIAPYPTGTIRSFPTEKTAVEDDAADWQPDNDIIEPQGIFQLPDGRLVLSRSCAAE